MKKRIALLSDVHGNITALTAVIHDLKAQEVDECWFLGDLVMPGPGADKLFDLLESIDTSIYIKGNWDNHLLTVLNSKEEIDLNDPSDVYIGMLGKYLSQKLSDSNIKKIGEFKPNDTQLINELRINISHNSPNKNYGQFLSQTAETEHFDELFEDSNSDIAVYGHVHFQMLRYTNDGRIVINPGTIGQTFFLEEKLNSDRRAQYAIMEIDDDGLADVDFRKVAYNLDSEVMLGTASGLPYSDLYSEMIYYGRSYRHALNFLDKINEKYDYVNILRSFLEF